MTTAHKVLVTGSAGRIGRAAVRELKQRGHFVRGFDLSADPHSHECVVGSITDPDAFGRAALEWMPWFIWPQRRTMTIS